MSSSDRKPIDFAQPIDRRGLLLAAGAAAAMLPFAPLEAAAGDKLLRRAIRRAGGYKVLSRVRLLSWEGEATVFDGDRRIELGVSTIVAPFTSARSTTWLLSEGKASARTMIITETGGRVERNGRTEPLPARLVTHERAQFAMYGLMLLAPLDRGGGSIRQPHIPSSGFDILRVSHKLAPLTRLFFETDGRLAEAVNTVPHPETGRPVRQRFIFSEEQMPGPVRWPRTIRIEQEGSPVFELRLTRFEAVS
ncbi:MAG TPA: hypothetical protein VIT45_15865 [Allosphingosinicella sp.]